MTNHPVSFEIERDALMSQPTGRRDGALDQAGLGYVEPPHAKESAEPVSLSPVDGPSKATTEPTVRAGTTRKKTGWRGPLLAGAGLLAIAVASDFGWQYWTVGRFQVSTDDAYVQADSTAIAPRVSGYIASVEVADNEPVKAGRVLARIDDRDFRVALDQAKADVAAASAAVTSKLVALNTQQSIIDSARATVAVDQANQTFAEQDDKRYTTLAATGFGTVQNAQQAAARIAASHAGVARDISALATAVQRTEILKADLAQAQATLAHDQASQRQAELNLSYTMIVSAVDGVVGDRTLRTGQYVQAGTLLMAVVPVAAAYIVANYKETQLTNVHAGQRVSIGVDMFPGTIVRGHVDSLAPASGQEFALLPPDNATGNFTKVVQRIPVKIVLDPDTPLIGDLRPGMSVYPTIETKADHSAARAD